MYPTAYRRRSRPTWGGRVGTPSKWPCSARRQTDAEIHVGFNKQSTNDLGTGYPIRAWQRSHSLACPPESVAVLSNTMFIRRAAEVKFLTARSVDEAAPENNPQPSLPQQGRGSRQSPAGDSHPNHSPFYHTEKNRATSPPNKHSLRNPTSDMHSSRPHAPETSKSLQFRKNTRDV